jgi:hypothetical protein
VACCAEAVIKEPQTQNHGRLDEFAAETRAWWRRKVTPAYKLKLIIAHVMVDVDVILSGFNSSCFLGLSHCKFLIQNCRFHPDT